MAGWARGCGSEPGAVVGDLHQTAIVPLLHGDADMARRGVLDHVGDGLLGDPIERHSRRGRERYRLRTREAELDALILLHLGQTVTDRAEQVTVVKPGGAQVEHQTPKTRDRSPHHLLHRVEGAPCRLVVDPPPECVQPEPDGGEDLQGVVVDVGGDGPALVLMRLDKEAHQPEALPTHAIQLLQAACEICGAPPLRTVDAEVVAKSREVGGLGVIEAGEVRRADLDGAESVFAVQHRNAQGLPHRAGGARLREGQSPAADGPRHQGGWDSLC